MVKVNILAKIVVLVDAYISVLSINAMIVVLAYVNTVNFAQPVKNAVLFIANMVEININVVNVVLVFVNMVISKKLVLIAVLIDACIIETNITALNVVLIIDVRTISKKVDAKIAALAFANTADANIGVVIVVLIRVFVSRLAVDNRRLSCFLAN